MVVFPQHPRELVGLEHQGGKQEVSAASVATCLSLSRVVIPLAAPFGHFSFQIESSPPGQLRTHHSREDVSVVLTGILQHAAKTSHSNCFKVLKQQYYTTTTTTTTCVPGLAVVPLAASVHALPEHSGILCSTQSWCAPQPIRS